MVLIWDSFRAAVSFVMNRDKIHDDDEEILTIRKEIDYDSPMRDTLAPFH